MGINEPSNHQREHGALANAIASGFRKLLPFFKMYSAYSFAYSNSTMAIDEAREESDAVDEVIESAHVRSGTSLEALLFRPVQRLCVYPLLLKQAMQHAPAGPTRDIFAATFSEMEAMIGRINDDVRRQHEQLRAVDVLLNQIGETAADLVDPSRSLLFEKRVQMRCTNSFLPHWQVKRAHFWFVFSDTLLICHKKYTSQGLHEIARVPLKTIQIVDDGNARGADDAPFELKCWPAEGMAKYRVWAGGTAERNSLIQMLRESIFKAFLNEKPSPPSTSSRKSIQLSPKSEGSQRKPMRSTLTHPLLT